LREDGFPLVRGSAKGLCCADERKWAGAIAREHGRNETIGCDAGCGAAFGPSGALLSELFGGIERKPLQVKLSQVRILFELLGLLLNVKIFAQTYA
jgi:hypothetical protein